MELLISILALLIAVAEFWMLILEHRKINREKKEQEEKERLIATFAEQTSKINDFTETFFSAINTIQYYRKVKCEDASTKLNGILPQYLKVINVSSQAYDSFDRMINACRNFCYNSRAVITECRKKFDTLNSRFHEIYNLVQNGEPYLPKYNSEFDQLNGDLYNTILKLYPLVEELDPYIFELNTKYDIQSDMDKQ